MTSPRKLRYSLAILLPLLFSATSRAQAEKSPAFEVATIKPANPNEPGILGLVANGGKITVGFATLKMLIYYAFDLDQSRIEGGPAWVNSTRYNVSAMPPADLRDVGGPKNRATPTPQERLMLRALLADRFGLRYHMADTEQSVYTLRKSSRKLSLSTPADSTADARGTVMMKGQIIDGESFGQNITMEAFARSLSRILRQPVIDQTGLTQSYDFHTDPVDPTNTDLMTGVVEALRQLGLELKSGKAPVPTLHIDEVHEPTPN